MKRKFLSVILAAVLSVNLAVGVSAGDIDVMMIEDASDDKIVSEDAETGISIDTEEDSDVQIEENIDEESSEDAESDELDLSDSETTEFSDGAAEAGVTEHGTVGGYIPGDLDYNAPIYNGDNSARAIRVPSAYQSDIAGLREKYPSVRNQNPYGSCWAFSTMGLAEFDLINKGLNDRNIDLSELQLAYFTYNSVEDPLGGTKGDTSVYDNAIAPRNYLNYGGTYEMAVRRLSQWTGAVNESDVPYGNAVDVLANGVDASYAYNKDVAHLENASLINIKQNPDGVKEQIMEHGAVGTMYTNYYAGMAYALGNGYNTYYDTEYTTGGGGSHAIMIVGWDDNFSKDNFSVDDTIGREKPSSDGAWLIRNSWGNDFDYFWMSYDTYSLSKSTAWAMDFESVGNYDNNYQLDGGLDTYKSTTSTIVANVFKVDQKTNVSSETLKAVSLSFTHEAQVGYTIDIYTDLKYYWNPKSGEHQTAATTSGQTTYAGVYTIPLESDVELKPGTRFAVVVTMDKAAIDGEQALSYHNDENEIFWKCTTIADRNSYYYKDDDTSKGFIMSYANFCIKAFTTNNSYKITYELNGGENSTDNPTAYGGNDEPIILKDPTRGDGYAFDGWYLESDYQTRITEIPANASGEYTLYAKWVSATGEEAEGYSLNLDGNIAINMYMKLPDKLKENADAYMEFTLPNGTVSKVSVKDATVEKDCYVFTGKVAAKEMAKAVKVRMYADDTEYGKEYTVSVQNYANYILRKADTYSDTVVSLVKRMLNYGAASQEMFGYEVNNLANNILEDADKNVGTYEFNDYKYTYNHDGYLPVSWYGSSLLLESDTCVRDYFYLNGPSGIDAYSFKAIINNGTPIELTPIQKTLNGKDYYYVDIPNIKAQNLDQSIEIKVASKSQPETEILSLKYNAFSYAYSLACMSNPDQRNVKVMNAMYEYWKMARQYVAEKNSNS